VHREAFSRQQTCRPRHAALTDCVAGQMELYTALPDASWRCSYPLPHRLSGELCGAAGSPPPTPAHQPTPKCSVGGASRGFYRPPAAHPPALPRLPRTPCLPPNTYAQEYTKSKATKREKNHNHSRLSVRQPENGGTHKRPRSTQSLLCCGNQTTTSSSIAAGIRPAHEITRSTKRVEQPLRKVQLVKGLGVGVGMASALEPVLTPYADVTASLVVVAAQTG